MLQSLEQAERQVTTISFLWILAHSGTPGNEEAHRAALSTTEVGIRPRKNLSLRIREKRRVCELVMEKLASTKQAEDRLRRLGKYTWRVDGALPGKHTLRLYGSLGSDQATVLAQCQTNHTHLRTYLARIKDEESPQCERGKEDDTVAHVLLRCPR